MTDPPELGLELSACPLFFPFDWCSLSSVSTAGLGVPCELDLAFLLRLDRERLLFLFLSGWSIFSSFFL